MSLDIERRIKSVYLTITLMLVVRGFASAQSTVEQVSAVLGEKILPSPVAIFQLRDYLLKQVPNPPASTSREQWTTESARLRQQLLNEVVFHGWSKNWVNAPPRFEDLGLIESGKGYRMHKLRYEIVPGFQSAAILYEPENLHGKVPAILDLNGHVGPVGKSIEYKQKQCINFALRGIITLNLEWLEFGELGQKENQHGYGGHLDLVGVNELGLFFLEMRRGLDYLLENPNVDPGRIGVTGLSGGGWQTIVLGSLDERVAVAVPVAGFSSIRSTVEAREYGDLGDLEQSGTDFLQGRDYPDLVALMVPRPTLLIYDAEDDCCYRAPLVKPLIFDSIKPLYKLYGKEEALGWHENRDPATHNYGLDNRLQAYRFFSKYFHLPLIESEIPVAAEVKNYDELVVGLPKDNLTILGLAQKLGREITHPPIPSEAASQADWAARTRENLKDVVRYKPVDIERLWPVMNTKNKGVETKSILFEMNNGLSADAVWLKAIEVPGNAPLTIILNDKGKKEAGVEVSDRVNRGEEVLALDLIGMGGAWDGKGMENFWEGKEYYEYVPLLHGNGDRALGLETAQLIAVAKEFRTQSGVPKARLETSGIRTQVVAMIASALEPNLFSAVVSQGAMRSLSYLLENPVTFQESPELFCLDLYKNFDLDRLAAMASPTKTEVGKYVELSNSKK